jgi:tellurite resistance protein
MSFKKKHRAYVEHGRDGAPTATQEQWNALVETMVIAACIDGILAPNESEQLAALILSTPGFEKLDNKGLAHAVEDVAERVATDGIEARVRQIAATLGDAVPLREEAFMLATLFVHFDGEVGEEEQEFLDLLQREMRISDERASHIDAVLAELSESKQGAR